MSTLKSSIEIANYYMFYFHISIQNKSETGSSTLQVRKILLIFYIRMFDYTIISLICSSQCICIQYTHYSIRYCAETFDILLTNESW